MTPYEQTDAMLGNRLKEMYLYVSRGATDTDLEAAGYSPEEIATVPKQEAIPFTPRESDNLSEYTPTAREKVRSNVAGIAETLGASKGYAYQLGEGVAGSDAQMGLLDITPVGTAMSVQEGGRQIERGYNTGSKTDMALGALDVGLGVVEAIPGAKLLTKGAEKIVDAIPGKVKADIVGTARSLLDGDAAFRSESKVAPVGVGAQATNALSIIFGGAKPTVVKPKMFATTSEGKLELNPESLMEFYSPTVEAIKSVEFPAKGYKGSELVKLLQTKSPGVRKAELDAMDLGIDPMKRYTKEEATALAEGKSYRVYTREVDDTQYKNSQRQQLKDKEVSYATLITDATPSSPDAPTFYPSKGSTHYNNSTIAHTRVSIRENLEGKQYLLVEEMQSDLVQHGALKPRKPMTKDAAYEDMLSSMSFEGTEKTFFDNNKESFTDLFKLAAEDQRIFNAKRKGLPVDEDSALNEARREKLLENFDLREMANAQGISLVEAKEVYRRVEGKATDAAYAVGKYMKGVVKSPLTEDADAVRIALQSAMSKASQSDVTSLVIPNLQRILMADRARLNSDKYKNYMSPTSGFTKTYKTGVEKFIAQLKEDYGDAVQVNTIELPYESTRAYTSAVPEDLDSTAIQIDFSGVKDANFKVGRFAEGGMVEDNQMDELMQEGGMADDGMSQEPVTGNDIPPGALASEVRDDVDAKLSEGEYVVPADVVRYFGVSFFEGLRTKAKEGLLDMEANGRIGGTPVDAQGVPAEDNMDELSPEEEQMLQQALGSTGMAEGGDVVGFDRTKFTLTPNDTSSFGTSAVTETRQYFNPTTGKKASVQFMDGMALGVIPAGFVPWSQTLEDSYNTTKPTPRESSSSNSSSSSESIMPTTDGSNSSGASFDYAKWADTNAEAINSNPYEFGMKALDDKSGNLTNKAIGIAGLATGLLPLAMLGAGLGAANKLQNVAEANAALKIMDSRGLTDSPEYQALAGKVKEYISDLPLAQQGAIATKVAATGNQYIEAIEAKSGNTTPPTTMTSAPTQRTPVQTTSNSGGSSSATRVAVPNKEPTSLAPTSSPRPVTRPTSTATTPAPTKVVTTPAGNKTVTIPKPTVTPQGGRFGFEDGGLVTKPKKTTPKSKGLGGKQ